MHPASSQTDALAVVREVTAAVAAAEDVELTLEHAARLTAQAVGVWECDVYEYVPQERKLVATATWAVAPTPYDEDWLGDTIDVDELVEYRLALESQSPVALHCDDPGISAGIRDVMDQWGEKSWLLVPLVYGGQAIGVLELVEERERHEFSEEETEIAMTIAVPTAIAIHNARLHRRTTEQNRYLNSLVETSRAIGATVDLDEILTRVAREACETLGTSQAAIYVHDTERDALIFRILYDRERSQTPEGPLGVVCPLDDRPTDRLILASDHIVVEHASDPTIPPDRRNSIETWNERTVLSVPLRFRDELLGILRLYESAREREFTPLELQFAQGLGELAGAALQNAQGFRREQARGLELETLLEASKAMASSMELDAVLGQLAQRAGVALGSPRCLIYEYDAQRDAIVLRSAFGADGSGHGDGDHIGSMYPLGDFPSDRETLRLGRIAEEHVSDPDTHADVRASMERNGEKACLTVPLVFRGRSLGIMELIETERERHFTESEVRLARALAEQAAIALNNARLYQRSKEYAARLESSYLETVTALAAAMEAKDHYTAEHADMLATMAVSVGRKIGLDESELRDLQYASVLHDIGKIGVPGHILNKPDKLTDEEFALMAEHTIIGERIISTIDYLAPIGKAIRAAHERWDGRGYPDGLAGDDIPRPARILFVCDAFHAMTSDRPYRRAMPEGEALQELRRNAGAQFDPDVVDAFLDVWPHFRESEVKPRTPSLN